VSTELGKFIVGCLIGVALGLVIVFSSAVSIGWGILIVLCLGLSGGLMVVFRAWRYYGPL
jgi:F0F1-type ATP synthase assembly protein I